MLLIGWGVPPDEAARAAEGWGGDAYLVAEGPGGRIGWIWESRWDTPADADEFRSALAGKARLRIESCDGWIRVVRGGPGESLSAGPKP